MEQSSTGYFDTLRVSRSRLEGEVYISGAKNSILKLQTASLLTNEDVHLLNYPDSLLDAQVHEGMLEALGKTCVARGDALLVTEKNGLRTTLDWSGRSIRNTLLILGALTARYGEGRVPLPGGCKLGDRKYDLHVMVLTTLGAEVWEERGSLCARVRSGALRGCEITLPLRSTGATENAIICGTLARGKTIIRNPHVRPEILDLISMLNDMGARIQVFGQERIEVDGVEGLGGTTHSVIPDNMEAMTYLVAAAISGGEVEIVNFPEQHLEVPLIFLRESGARIYRREGAVIVKGCVPYPLTISTGPYPGINSDMQPILAVYGLMAKGESQIVDLRFKGRYGYMEELERMGAHYKVEGDILRIFGGRPLRGGPVVARDLRAGAALLLAGMVADGETTIADAWQIARGYDRVVDKLQRLGCQVVAE